MGETSRPLPVLLIVAIFSRYDEALAWAKTHCADHWGRVALESAPFAFEWTPYYEKSMGENLRKLFLAFEQPIDPGQLSELKHQTNSWEQEYAEHADHDVVRPLNLDPGYVTQRKLILASTKNHAHRNSERGHRDWSRLELFSKSLDSVDDTERLDPYVCRRNLNDERRQ